jgi:hypothetical protein
LLKPKSFSPLLGIFGILLLAIGLDLFRGALHRFPARLVDPQQTVLLLGMLSLLVYAAGVYFLARLILAANVGSRAAAAVMLALGLTGLLASTSYYWWTLTGLHVFLIYVPLSLTDVTCALLVVFGAAGLLRKPPAG